VSGGPPDDDRTRLLELLAGRCRAQAVASAARLGLGEALSRRPRAAAELADELGCDPDRLRRLLLYLVALGVCERVDGQGFGLTGVGRQLTDDALGPLASFLGSPEQWDSWSRLPEALTRPTGSAYEATHGHGLYERLARDTDAAAAYDRGIEAFTRDEALALAEALDLTDVRRLVDLGCGQGLALQALLNRWPALTGVLADAPAVVTAAAARLPAELAPRVQTWSGDFHREVPGPADAYLLAHVLHNWDDGRAVALLRRCAAGLAPGGRVFILETVLIAGDHADQARQLDLEMLVLTGGLERDKPAWRRLLAAAGLELLPARRVSPTSWLLTGRPLDD